MNRKESNLPNHSKLTYPVFADSAKMTYTRPTASGRCGICYLSAARFWLAELIMISPLARQKLLAEATEQQRVRPPTRLGPGRVASPRRPVLRSGCKSEATNDDGPLGDRTLPRPVLPSPDRPGPVGSHLRGDRLYGEVLSSRRPMLRARSPPSR